MLANLTLAAAHSVSVTGNESLPPYPALGLAWMMHSLNHPYPTLSEIQALHQLATLAASPATAKVLTDSTAFCGPKIKPSGSLPIPLVAPSNAPPSGPGIAPWSNVLLKPCPLVLLSQTSIKDHPQKPRIIALAKMLYNLDSPKAHQSCSGKDYLCQALKIVHPTDAKAKCASHQVAFTDAQGCTSHFLASSQDLFELPPTAPHLMCSFSQVAQALPKNSAEWSTVNRKPKPKGTIQGTKITTVIAAVPNGFRVPYLSLGINGPEFTEHIHDTLCAHPGEWIF